jgi:hypothetical protein
MLNHFNHEEISMKNFLLLFLVIVLFTFFGCGSKYIMQYNPPAKKIFTTDGAKSKINIECNDQAMKDGLIKSFTNANVEVSNDAEGKVVIDLNATTIYVVDKDNRHPNCTKDAGFDQVAVDLVDGNYVFCHLFNSLPNVTCNYFILKECDFLFASKDESILKKRSKVVLSSEMKMPVRPTIKYDSELPDYIVSSCLVADNNFTLLEKGTREQQKSMLNSILELKNKNAVSSIEKLLSRTKDPDVQSMCKLVLEGINS